MSSRIQKYLLSLFANVIHTHAAHLSVKILHLLEFAYIVIIQSNLAITREKGVEFETYRIFNITDTHTHTQITRGQVFDKRKLSAYFRVLYRARIKIEDKAITAISISVDSGVTNYNGVRDTTRDEKKGGENVFRSGKKCHQRRNTSLPQSHVYNAPRETRATRVLSIESKNKFHPPCPPIGAANRVRPPHRQISAIRPQRVSSAQYHRPS